MTQPPQGWQPRVAVGYSANNWTCALSILRLVGPLRACGMQFIEGNEDITVYPERVSLADVVIIQRDFPRFCKEYDQVIQRARDEGKPVIFDIDDLIFELPSDHPDQISDYYDRSLLGMLHAVVEVDAVTVSTPALRAYYQAFHSNTWVLPNYINEEVWKLDLAGGTGNADCGDGSQGAFSATDRDRVVIGFMGGDSHQPDIVSIAPVLHHLAASYGNRIALRFLGIKPPESVVSLSDLCPVEWVPLDSADYSRFATLFKCNKPDIAIAPLTDTLFNRCKSALKYFEYSALGLPGVYSALTPYVETVVHGQNGFLARTHDEWLVHLRALIDDAALRTKIGTAALTTVKERWLLAQHAHEWRDTYAQILAPHTAHPPAVAPARRAVRQMLTWQHRHESKNTGEERALLVQNLTAERQTNARLLWELSKAKENMRLQQVQLAMLGQGDGKYLPGEWQTNSHLFRELPQTTQNDVSQATEISNLRVQLAQVNDMYAAAQLHLTEQARRANAMRACFGQLDAHLAALTAYVAYQSRIIQGLLNGRVLRTIMHLQTRLAGVLIRKDSSAAHGFVVSPPPALPGVDTAAVDWHIPFALEPEPKAIFNRLFKRMQTRSYGAALAGFISSNERLHVSTGESPVVTIIIPVHNRAELTLQCLRSIQDSICEPCEIIVVDDQSSDATQDLLQHVNGIRVIRNTENQHFLRSCNRAAAIAHGQYLLFLNNDVQLLPGAIDSALKTIRNAPDGAIGAVGARIILLDSTLQEAGSIVWNDGSCLGYGRGDDPTAAPYMFARDVDYCSGAFLLTPRALFADLGGFDERFAPAYYEDTDYCLRLWEHGNRVVYDPNAVVMHYETASYKEEERSNASQLQERNRAILVDRHAESLKWHLPSGKSTLSLLARNAANQKQKRILYIDDRVPYASLGSGFPRAREIVLALIDLGYQVTLYPLRFPFEAWDRAYAEIPNTVEVMLNHGVEKLEPFLEQRWWYYDTIMISRPHNASLFRQILERHAEWFSRTRIIYDAEAIYAVRDAIRRRLGGEIVGEDELVANIRDEVNLAHGADAVMCVSASERDRFRAAGYTNVHILGHAVKPNPTLNGFVERQGILFVGTIQEDTAPNADAVLWFANEIFPLIRQQLGSDVSFTVVGSNGSDKVRGLTGEGIQFVGRVEDLTPYYNQARIFVAPTRYAAGIPIKMQDAAAHGIPIVCTSLLANEVGWQDGVDILVGDEPATFAAQCARLYTNQATWYTLRGAALQRIEHECSPTTFQDVIRLTLAENGAEKKTPGIHETGFRTS